MTYFLKRCPKCVGDLVLQSDQYGRFLCCLQCGFIKDEFPSRPIETGPSGKVRYGGRRGTS